MFFQNLDKRVQQAIVDLTTDQNFQLKFATDPILDSLQEAKTDSKLELYTLKHILRTEPLFITPALWSFLWSIKSPIVNDLTKITDADVDFLFYLIENGVEQATSNISDVFNSSLGYCKRNEIDYDTARQMIKIFITIGFRPLNQFTSDYISETGGKPQFDADWLTGLATRVHLVTGYDPMFIMKRMSLTQACFYYLQYAKVNGAKNVSKRTSEQLLAAMDHRAAELVIDALIEKGVIQQVERETYIQIITENPNK